MYLMDAEASHPGPRQAPSRDASHPLLPSPLGVLQARSFTVYGPSWPNRPLLPPPRTPPSTPTKDQPMPSWPLPRECTPLYTGYPLSPC